MSKGTRFNSNLSDPPITSDVSGSWGLGERMSQGASSSSKKTRVGTAPSGAGRSWGLTVNRGSSSEEPQSGNSSKGLGSGDFKARSTRKQSQSDVKDPTALRRRVTQQLVKEWSLTDAQAESKGHRYARKIGVCVDSISFTALTGVLTVWALIGDDLRLMYTDKPDDNIFNVLTGICILVFLVEIILSCIAKDDYYMGFFFTLDCVSTVTLVLDLTFVNEALIQRNEEGVDNIKSSRTARIGARAARIVRVLRLIRLLKLMKVFSDFNRKRRRKQRHNMEEWDSDDEAEEAEAMAKSMRESQVGKKLSELTTRRIVVLVLTMMLCIPFLSIGNEEQLPTSLNYGADVISEAYAKLQSDFSRKASFEQVLLQYIFYHNWFAQEAGCNPETRRCPADYWTSIFWFGIAGESEEAVRANSQLASVSSISAKQFFEEARKRDTLFNYGPPPPDEIFDLVSGPWNITCRNQQWLRIGVSVLVDKISGKVSYAVKCPEDLRNAERTKVTPRLLTKDEFTDWHFCFYVDNRPFVRTESICNLMMVGFICVVLGVASAMIGSDANNLILRPLENMMLKVQMIRINPLMATKLADDAFKAEEKKKSRLESSRKRRVTQVIRMLLCTSPEAQERPMETRILENTIIKLGTLLALGFGEAGANITSRNMGSDNNGSVNGMVAGTPVDCIIGFASIQDFSVLTEALQKNIMTFVNQVSEIVHGVIEEYSGAPNKNNGDSFLVIWTTCELKKEHISKIADMSLLSFVRIFAAVHSSRVLAAYREHPLLQQRMGSHFSVTLTFGLHAGWAIEGAVGTEFKIDASYLSPNVSIAQSVQGATKLYGVHLLVTESVMKACTKEMGAKCRLIDNVIVTGSPKAMQLYCIDVNSMFVDVEPAYHCPKWNSLTRYRARQFLDAEKTLKWSEDVHMLEFFAHSLEVNALRMPYSKDFSYIFNMGYQNYNQGEWGAAERILAKTKTMLGFEDGPSAALLQFMKDPFDFVAPDWWKGVHNLDADLSGQGVSIRPFPPTQSRAMNLKALKVETGESLDKVFPGLRGAANPDRKSVV